MSKKEVSWREKPAAEDYKAALAYLTLLMSHPDAQKVIRALRSARTQEWVAKDLLRASRLTLGASDDRHVSSDLKRLNKGKPLSPILLLRGDLATGHGSLTIADGYHRICAVCHFNEDAPVRCRIAALE